MSSVGVEVMRREIIAYTVLMSGADIEQKYTMKP